jgi:leucyl-tRNA synthetase
MFLRVLAPFAPHITEELWTLQGESSSIHLASFPQADPSRLVASEVVVVVQVNGKKRGELTIAKENDESAVIEAAKAIPGVASALLGKTVTRQIYVPGRLVNFVIS